MMAASCNYADLLRLLIERGAAVDIKANDPGAKTPLLESFNQMAPHLEIVRILVESGADVNAVDAFGNTPLTLASMKLGFLEASWQHAQKYKVRDTESAANADGYAQIVRYLVSKGAKVDVKNNKGQTAYDAINEYGVGVLEAISSDIIQLIKPEKSSF
jgi:ankyrin repeat protein